VGDVVDPVIGQSDENVLVYFSEFKCSDDVGI